MLEIVKTLDNIIEKNINKETTLKELVDLVYAGAVTACGEIATKLIQSDPKHHRDSEPPWRKRLEEKIIRERGKIGVINAYLNTEAPSRRLRKKILKIASELSMKRSDENLRRELILVCDKLKQKIKALGNRMNRYNERIKRFKNNQLFHKNQQQFFRSLEEGKETEGEPPTIQEMHATWKEIWEDQRVHDDEAFWIREAEREAGKYTMEALKITEEDIHRALKGTKNWSAPGSDGLQNYWWKNFRSTYTSLAKMFQEALKDPPMIPESFTLGVTHMIFKGENTSDPKNYRPITCLLTVYKILTGILTSHIWKHVDRYRIMAPEQNGCRKNARGCKEMLNIDYLVTKLAKKKQRNLSVAWIDYRKAFDSIPHSWLLKTLQLYGVSEPVINLIRSC